MTQTMVERLEAVPDSVLFHGAELRTYSNLGVARTALFDLDYEGFTLIQVWDHNADSVPGNGDNAWFHALLRWADNEVLKIWEPDEKPVDDIIKESVDLVSKWMSEKNR